MGVSTALVQHWEQGFRKPSRMACRLFDEINRDPGRWSKMITRRKSA
jgi:DNA-binding transcriptional regulator YiaG